MKVIFIGTGSGFASLNRFHSSFIISTQNYNLLVDCGDSISRALLKQKIPYNYFDGIVISHMHPDHYSGLAALFIQMKLTKRLKKLQLFIYKNLINVIKEFLFTSYLFKEKMDFEVEFIPIGENRKVNIKNSFNLYAKKNSHLSSYKIFDKKNKLDFTSLSFLFEHKNTKIFYTADIGTAEDLYLFEEELPQYLITEFTHISDEDILKAFNLLKPQKIILTHLTDEENKTARLLSLLPKDKIIAASDGMILNF